jgi:hypothetical protein
LPCIAARPLSKREIQSVPKKSFSRAAEAINWRVTVVDNNSSDHTRQIIESFAARSPHVRYRSGNPGRAQSVRKLEFHHPVRHSKRALWLRGTPKSDHTCTPEKRPTR